MSSILCAALYPNIVKILTPSKSYVMSAAGAVPKENEAKDLRFATAQEIVSTKIRRETFKLEKFCSEGVYAPEFRQLLSEEFP